MASRSQLFSWRKFLNEIAVQLTTDNVRTITFLCNLPAGLAETVKDGTSLLLALEKEGIINEADVNPLCELIELVPRKDLLYRIKEYQDIQMQGKSKRDKLGEQSGPIQDLKCTDDQIEPRTGTATKQEARKVSPNVKPAHASSLLLKPSHFTSNSNINRKSVKVASTNDESSTSGDEGFSYEDGEHRASQEEFVQEAYQVKSFPRGKCLVINNHKFNGAKVGNKVLEDRDGTHLDGEAVVDVFEWLGFVVDILDNNSGNQIRNNLKKCANDDHQMYDMFSCVIMSHGLEGGVYGVDGEGVSFKEMVSFFQASQNLAGKPKLFFIQACQGDEDMAEIHTDSPKLLRNSPEPERKSLPAGSDFFFAVATTPGAVSWRSRRSGSWFIQTLCTTLKRLARTFDINQIMTEVNKVVAEQSAKVDKHIARQVSDFGRNSLRKQLFLKPRSSYLDYVAGRASGHGPTD